MNKVNALAFTAALATLPWGVAQASHLSTDSVSINPVSTSGCGTQELTFSGTGTYSESTQHLVVALDGSEVLNRTDEPANWTTGPVTVNPGSHSLTATIYDTFTLEDVRATTTTSFSVSDCGASSGSSEVSGSGDCCPGPDVVTTKTTGKVKGAATVSTKRGLPQRIAPINELFRKVYGRAPKFAEWEYWAHRQLTDKPQYDALYGAMQWHQLRGHTTGGTNPILL